MKAQELRIGNKFINPKFPNILDEVQQIHSEYAISDYSDSIAIADMLPVPLTPELLERCGFDIVDSNDDEDVKLHRIQVSNQSALYCNATDVNGSWDWFISYYWNDNHYKHDFYSEIACLHQLQNLFYSLTSTELTIQQK